MGPYLFEPIGRIHSCFKEKFGIPRQPGLVAEARAVLEILPPYQHAEAFRGLDDFTHIWVLFVFHCCDRPVWKPTVRPPRLGGNRRLGVFATRSGFRPNPIGQSAVCLDRIEEGKGRLSLHLSGVDLLDGTPVLDIKPYLPYADSIARARAGYAQQPPSAPWTVHFSDAAVKSCSTLEDRHPDLQVLIRRLLACDPRPAYRQTEGRKLFGMRLWDLNITFRYETGVIRVETVDQAAWQRDEA
jgi:tRNA-Thr(GGU) m(6)t(6)A37 methyltransferase TsaA